MPFLEKNSHSSQNGSPVIGPMSCYREKLYLIIFDKANPELNDPHTEQASKMGKNYE